VTISRDRQAEEVAERIRQITGRAEAVPAANSDLSYRTEDIETFLIKPEISLKTRVLELKQIVVEILVDESGNVVRAEALTRDQKLKDKAQSKVLKYKFKPFVENGKSEKMRGGVYFTFTE
jgi:hypothetical protein